MLEIKNLYKQFGNNSPVIKNLSITVPAGKIFGFLGPNGAGKTTTMRLVAGILKPTSGTIVVNGFDIINNEIESKKIIGYIPDNPFLYEKLTGYEFLELTAGLYEIPDNIALNRASYYLNYFELNEKKDNLIESYSQGMRQKISVISSILHAPKLLLVDEPLIGLDPKSARNMKKLFIKMRDEGCTIIMSTHILEICEEICDSVGIIHRGELVIDGELQEVKMTKGVVGQRLEDIFLEMIRQREIELGFNLGL